MFKALVTAGLLVGAACATTACTQDYGYGGVRADYAYGYGYGYPGWYGDYYYPGSGYFVYDRYHRPLRWNDDQRRYWEARRYALRGRPGRDNWDGFGRNGYRGVLPQGGLAPGYRSNGYRAGTTPASPSAAAPPPARAYRGVGLHGGGQGGGRHERR